MYRVFGFDPQILRPAPDRKVDYFGAPPSGFGKSVPIFWRFWVGAPAVPVLPCPCPCPRPVLRWKLRKRSEFPLNPRAPVQTNPTKSI